MKSSNRLDEDAKKTKAAKFSKKSKSKQKHKQPMTTGDELVKAADNNDEDCSAVMCLKPLGRYLFHIASHVDKSFIKSLY